MIPPEDSTFDLIRRRGVHPYTTSHAISLLLILSLGLLPLLKLDVSIQCTGMIRPGIKPVDLTAPFTGILERCTLRDGYHVKRGDTLAIIRSDTHQARMKMYHVLLNDLEQECRDIERILTGGVPMESTRILHSFNSHRAMRSGMTIKKELAYEDFRNAETLYYLEVLPRMDFLKIRAAYKVAASSLTEAEETYYRSLGSELKELKKNGEQIRGELKSIEKTVEAHVIRAPLGGTLIGCQGLYQGLVIQEGHQMATISPSGQMVAECYLLPHQIAGLRKDLPVKIRFQQEAISRVQVMKARVEYIGNDVTNMGGQPCCIVRCSIAEPGIRQPDGAFRQVRKGMTFTADIVLTRKSLGRLIMERFIRWVHPVKQYPKA